MSESNSSPLLIARQPFLNSRRAVFGYELTFNSPTQEAADPQLEAEQILECLSEQFDPRILANGRSILVRLTPQTIVDQSYSTLPSEITIIELDATDIHWDEPFKEACRELKRKGFRLCLVGRMDDLQCVLDVGVSVDYFKVHEARDIAVADCQQRLSDLRRGDASIIACGIECPEQFEHAKEGGFDLFEGYFFFKPQVLEHREIPLMQMNQVKFLQAVNQPDLDVNELEKLIRGDASLSVGLMRLINSAAFGISQQVTSIQRALLLLGPQKVRKWATSLVVKNLAGNKSPEVITLCLMRAFFCESLGTTTKSDDSPLDLFMMGIVSGLDPSH